ncbi:MAG: extradiol dioxygenase [Verrucomicrobiota bacterium]|nr:extradiol dioxygenase [Verrucomicrobiota bacterium]
MINGAHSIIYSSNPEADRAFLRDVLQLPHVDVGHGWLIFGLPPAEVAIHPGEKNDHHEFYFMCDDLDLFMREMSSNGLRCGEAHDEPWGRVTQVALPGGGKIGVYQPRHPRPPALSAA